MPPKIQLVTTIRKKKTSVITEPQLPQPLVTSKLPSTTVSKLSQPQHRAPAAEEEVRGNPQVPKPRGKVIVTKVLVPTATAHKRNEKRSADKRTENKVEKRQDKKIHKKEEPRARVRRQRADGGHNHLRTRIHLQRHKKTGVDESESTDSSNCGSDDDSLYDVDADRGGTVKGSGGGVKEHECVDLIARIDPTNDISKEDMIEKLENQQYTLRKSIKRSKHKRENADKLLHTLKITEKILSDLRRADLEEKANYNIAHKKSLRKEFKKTHVKLKRKDFDKIVDLTAPKKERKPEVGVKLWRTSKDVVFKDGKYTNLGKKKTDQFRAKLKPPVMADEWRNKIEDNQKDVYMKANVVFNRPDMLAYHRYNPLTYQGLSYY